MRDMRCEPLARMKRPVVPMDVTLRNVDEQAFRRFKAGCAAAGVTMGEAVSSLMRLHPPSRRPAVRTPAQTRPQPSIRDLGDHLRMLHSRERSAARPHYRRRR